MTNKEAIMHLSTIKIYSYQDGYTDAAREALEMAITALQELNNSNQEVNNSNLTQINAIKTHVKGMPEDDTISRQAAIDAIIKADYEFTGILSEPRARMFEQTINALPPAQPDNQIKLCDSCYYSYPDCPSKNDDVIFGNGIGNDNICACNKYKPSVQPEIIRCRDCRWRKDQSGSTAWLPCRAIETPSDFYCGRAERRTDEPDK